MKKLFFLITLAVSLVSARADTVISYSATNFFSIYGISGVALTNDVTFTPVNKGFTIFGYSLIGGTDQVLHPTNQPTLFKLYPGLYRAVVSGIPVGIGLAVPSNAITNNFTDLITNGAVMFTLTNFNYYMVIDGNDTTPGRLGDKLVGGSGVTLTTNNIGGNEQIVLSFSTNLNAFVGQLGFTNGPIAFLVSSNGFTLMNTNGGIVNVNTNMEFLLTNRAGGLMKFGTNVWNLQLGNAGGSLQLSNGVFTIGANVTANNVTVLTNLTIGSASLVAGLTAITFTNATQAGINQQIFAQISSTIWTNTVNGSYVVTNGALCSLLNNAGQTLWTSPTLINSLWTVGAFGTGTAPGSSPVTVLTGPILTAGTIAVTNAQMSGTFNGTFNGSLLGGNGVTNNNVAAVNLPNAANALSGVLTATGGNVVTNKSTGTIMTNPVFTVPNGSSIFLNSFSYDLGQGSGLYAIALGVTNGIDFTHGILVDGNGASLDFNSKTLYGNWTSTGNIAAQQFVGGGASITGLSASNMPYNSPYSDGIIFSNQWLALQRVTYDFKDAYFASPIGWDPHFYLGANWTEADPLRAATNAFQTGIAAICHNQYSLDLTHWQVATNGWQYVPDPAKFPRGFNAFLTDAHNMGCIVKIYLDSVSPMGNDSFMTNSAGGAMGSWTNILPNLTNLAALYPTLDGLHYDANAGEDSVTAFQRAFMVDTVWRSLITNRPTFFEHDTFPPPAGLNHSFLGAMPDGQLWGICADPTSFIGTNGQFNVLLATMWSQTNLLNLTPSRGKYIQPQQMATFAVNGNGYVTYAQYNMAGAFGWGMILATGGGNIGNYTTNTGAPGSNDYALGGLWSTNQEFLSMKQDCFSAPYIVSADTNGNWVVWARALSDGSYAVLMVNLNLTNAQTFSFNFNQIGTPGQYYVPASKIYLRDPLYGTNVYLTNGVAFTNTLQPNYLGEPAKLYHVWFLNNRPVDLSAAVGSLANIGNVTASSLVITNNAAADASGAFDLAIGKPTAASAQIHLSVSNIIWNIHYASDSANLDFISSPDITAAKMSIKTNGTLNVYGNVNIGAGGNGGVIQYNGVSLLRVSSPASILSAVVANGPVYIGLDNSSAGVIFWNRLGYAGDVLTNGAHFVVAVSVTNGIGSLATNSLSTFNAGGITNTAAVNVTVYGFTGTSVTLSNNLSKFNSSLGTITSPQNITLQPGDMLYGSSCAESTNRYW